MAILCSKKTWKMPDSCNITELAAMCGVRERTVQKWIQYKQVPEPRNGLWTPEEAQRILKSWMQRRRNEAPKKPNRKRQIYD